MLDIRKYIDLKNDQKIIASCYTRSLKGECIVLALSDNTILLNLKCSSKDDNRTKIVKWFRYQKICCMKFSHYGLVLNILNTQGLMIRVPLNVLLQDNYNQKWETFISTSDPVEYLTKLKNEKYAESKYERIC